MSTARYTRKDLELLKVAELRKVIAQMEDLNLPNRNLTRDEYIEMILAAQSSGNTADSNAGTGSTGTISQEEPAPSSSVPSTPLRERRSTRQASTASSSTSTSAASSSSTSNADSGYGSEDVPAVSAPLSSSAASTGQATTTRTADSLGSVLLRITIALCVLCTALVVIGALVNRADHTEL